MLTSEEGVGVATYNKQLDDLIKTSNACSGTDCNDALAQLGQGGNYNYSVMESSDKKSINAIKLDNLKVSVKIKPKDPEAGNLAKSYPWVNDMAEQIKELYGLKVGNCIINGMSCTNLMKIYFR